MICMHVRLMTPAFAFLIVLNISLSAGEKAPERYRVSFVLGTVELRGEGKNTPVKQGDLISEGDILVIGNKSLVELNPEPGDTSFKISGPLMYRCTRHKLARDFSRNSLVYRLYSKLSQDTYHYYPRTVISAVRGKTDPDSDVFSGGQEDEMKEAIDLFKAARIDESLEKFDRLAARDDLQKHARHLVNFYRAEIFFTKLEYEKAMNLYLSLYRVRSRQFRHGEIAHCRAILCSVYAERPDQAKELIAEYENIFGKNGAYSPLLDELKEGIMEPLQ